MKFNEPWSIHLKRGLIIFVIGKIVMGLQNVVFPKPVIKPVSVSHQLDTLYDDTSDSFRVLDRDNVTFLIKPHRQCGAEYGTRYVFLVLTAPANVEKRDLLRRQIEQRRQDTFLLFLLGKTSSQDLQEQLVSENMIHGDIVQISVMDHYTRLSYKTLSGYIWTSRFCGSVRYTVKIDDDIKFNFPHLDSLVSSKFGDVEPVPDIIECPSVMRNMRPWRQSHPGSLMGKWSISKRDMPRRVFPSFCPGWLYITTPRVGLALAEVAVIKHDHLINKSKLDDIFVSGFIREYLPDVKLSQLGDGRIGKWWNNLFSHCPFMGITKNIFFNEIVEEKGSGGVSYIKGQKFYWCAFLEFFILENIEYVIPTLSHYTPPLWALCARK